MANDWDQSKFDAVLDRYIEVNGRDVATILNSKAYFVARRALWNTRKADTKEIRALRQARHRDGGLLVGAMIQKQRMEYLGAGHGLYGRPMRKAIDQLLASRLRAIAFLKSGWIPAIQGLDPKAEDKAGAAPRVSGVRQFGVPKGGFNVARPSSLVAKIINTAQALSDTKGALENIGGEGLRRAFADEAASMEAYIEKKLKKAADKATKDMA